MEPPAASGGAGDFDWMALDPDLRPHAIAAGLLTGPERAPAASPEGHNGDNWGGQTGRRVSSETGMLGGDEDDGEGETSDEDEDVEEEEGGAAGGATGTSAEPRASSAQVETQVEYELDAPSSHWQGRFAADIVAARDVIDAEIKKLAVKATVDTDAVRRALRLNRPGHRKATMWNRFERYHKEHPEQVEEWRKEHPEAKKLKELYRVLSPANKKTITDWRDETLVIGDLRDVQASVNAAFKSVSKVLEDLAADHGVMCVVFVAHPDPESRGYVGGGADAQACLEKVISRINPHYNLNRLSILYERAVSLDPSDAYVGTLKKLADIREREAALRTSESSGRGSKRTRLAAGSGDGKEDDSYRRLAVVAAQLETYLRASVVALGTPAGADAWKEKIRGSSGPLFYAEFFDALKAANLRISGWPQASVGMLADDVEKVPQTRLAGAPFVISGGSLRSTDKWRTAAINGLLGAMAENTLRCEVIQSGDDVAA
ncbi:hypothetical protein V8E36_002284 [Tilletia maclaganii]